MYSVKIELDKNNVCFGCLSPDRQLKPLETHLTLFYMLLERRQLYNKKILLCWECKTLLGKTWMFQKRIQRAQFILQQSFCSMSESWELLSTLSFTRKDSYDLMIEHDEDKSKQNEKELCNTEIPVELTDIFEENSYNEKADVDIKEELDDDYYEDTKLENDHSTDMDDEFDVKKTNHEPKAIKKDESDADYTPYDKPLSEKKGSYLEAYIDKVRIVDGDIDAEDVKKYYVEVSLPGSEIEELLERENNISRPGVRRDRPFQCKHCQNAYKRDVDYKRHVTFNHNLRRTGYQKCKKCHKSLQNFEILENHWLQVHNKYYKCTICGLIMHRYSAMLSHIETAHSKKFVCLLCSENSSNMKEFVKHYKAKHVRMICDDCGKSFIKKRSFEVHYKRHHKTPTCEVCDKTYSTYHNLENHYRLNHPEMVNCENRRELAYCVECNKQFPSVYKYRRHLTSAAIHSPPKKEICPCPECGKVFSRKIRMTNHVMSVHKKNTKHRCDICNKTFCSAYAAKTHRKCVHDKVPMPKNKFCDICGRGFSTNRILANHRRTHTGERPYACPHCPATFAQRVAMKTHAKTQHKNLVLDASNQVIDNGILP